MPPLCNILGNHWTEIGVDSIARLYDVFRTTAWSRNLLLYAVFSLNQGVGYLLELANISPNTEPRRQEEILLFLQQNISELRHKTQRIEEAEVNAVLSVLSRWSFAVGDSSGNTLTSNHLTGSEIPETVVRAALEFFKELVRVTRCALLCCRLNGLEILYQLMGGRSAHQESSMLTGLEVCCYLTGHEASNNGESDNASILKLIQLLFLLVDARCNGLVFAHLVFLITDRCGSLDTSIFTFSLVQHCRTQVLRWRYRGATEVVQEEAGETIRRLYAIRERVGGSQPKENSQDSNRPRPRGNELGGLKDSIIAFSSLVKCESSAHNSKGDAQPMYMYVNLKTPQDIREKFTGTTGIQSIERRGPQVDISAAQCGTCSG